MGPLKGIRVVEFAGMAAAPYCAMLLADLGAEVIRIERAGVVPPPYGYDPTKDVLGRGRRSIALNMKEPQGLEAALRLVERADILLEGYRPGAMERMGVGPDVCLARNPRLVYGRMTGWGQTGPVSHTAGHDINYIALSGVLGMLGREGEPPQPPLNLLADSAGGLMLAFGVMCALTHARATGEGQVVDAAMLEASTSLLAQILALRANGNWTDVRGGNIGDGGAHFYGAYETSDGRYMSVGAIEPQFYAILCEKAELDPELFGDRTDTAAWPALKKKLAEVIKTKTRAEWVEIFDGLDACVAPVLTLEEAIHHPHNVARGVYVEKDGALQTAPTPRFSRTPGALNLPPPRIGQHTEEILREIGLAEAAS